MDARQFFESKPSIQLILQTTWECNIRCKHCYESGSAYPKGIMSTEILEKVISMAISHYKVSDFLWFGGEPLMAGLDFFKTVVSLQKKYMDLYPGNEVKNCIQTNAILMTDEMIAFFKANHFSISVSYDGLFNDFLRQGTEKTVENIIKCQQAGLRINVLSVIHSGNYDKQYEMFKDFQSRNLKCKFNRIFAEGNALNNSKYLISNTDYINSMRDFFKKWLYDESACGFSTFDICFSSLFDLGNKECTLTGCMFKWIAVSPRGDTYTCPRFMGTEYTFGNVLDMENLFDCFFSEKYKELALKAIKRRTKCKDECPLYPYCNGGCNAQCYGKLGIENSSSDLCHYVKEFFPFVVNELHSALETKANCNPIVNDLIKSHGDRIVSVYNKMHEQGLI